MEEKSKKKSVFGVVCKIIFIAVIVYTGMKAIGAFIAKKTKELEAKNAGKKSKKYLAIMNGQIIKPDKEQVEEISIRSYLGGITLDLTETLLGQETEISVHGLMSGIVIKVPPMVRVELEGTNFLSGFANMVPKYETEDLPIIYVYAESLMSGIAVQMVPEKK